MQIGRLDHEIKIQQASLREMSGKEEEAKMTYERLRGEQQSVIESIRVPRERGILCI